MTTKKAAAKNAADTKGSSARGLIADVLNRKVGTTPAPKAETPAEATKRSVGRPIKRVGETQTTTIRLSADDHTKVRELALRDRRPMNDLVLEALREYMRKRGKPLSDS